MRSDPAAAHHAGMARPGGRGGPVRRAAALLYAVGRLRRQGVVRPVDEPTVRFGGDEGYRLLLIGNGPVHGWGVRSHRLAPTGHLAEGFGTVLRAPCTVELVGDEAMTAQTAEAWLGDRVDDSFHAVVVAIGASDAARLTPLGIWSDRMDALLGRIRRATGAPVVVVGVPDVAIARDVRRLHPLLAIRARRMDASTRRVVARHPDATFLPAPRLAHLVGGDPEGDVYPAFAAPIAAAVAGTVLGAPSPSAAPRAPQDLRRRDVAAVVDSARKGDVGALQQIVDRARAEFGVLEAGVTVLDGDRAYHAVNTGGSPFAVPRSLAYCTTVVTTGAPLVVPDGFRDERIAGRDYLELTYARFYAGTPIRGRDGVVIGALCLFHAFPRSADRVDLERLRRLGEEVEATVHRMAGEPAPIG